MHSQRLPRLLPILLLCFILSACGKGQPGPGGKTAVYTGPPCMDVLTLPQDLGAYAAGAGGSRALAPRSALEAAAGRQHALFFKPWTLTKPTRWVRQSLDHNFNMKPDRAYGENRQPFPLDVWQGLAVNSNKKAYGKGARPAITLRHTDLRAMPASMRFYLRPDLPGEGYPFDYFQHTSLQPGAPVYICNTSKDGLWLLVETPVTAGWVPARDVAGVSRDFMTRWQSRPLAALIRDKVDLRGVTGHVGTLLPLVNGANGASGANAAGPGMDQSLSVYVPRRGASGQAEASVLQLPAGAAAVVPLALTPDNVARVGNGMMGQPCGWGGLDEKRDCSALTRDLLAPFGFFLPRNSARQARVGRPLELAGLEAQEKERAIIREAAPFRSLIHMPGHIGLYLGTYQGKAVMFHNMWGLRTRDASGGCDGRAIVGKAVVTTLRPGVERPDLCYPNSFLDRIERAAILPE